MNEGEEGLLAKRMSYYYVDLVPQAKGTALSLMDRGLQRHLVSDVPSRGVLKEDT